MTDEPGHMKGHMQLYSSVGGYYTNFQNANVASEKSLEFALGFIPDGKCVWTRTNLTQMDETDARAQRDETQTCSSVPDSNSIL